MSHTGDKKDKDKKSSSGKDKDTKLLAEMTKDPNQEVIEQLVNKLGGRQAEALRKEFSQGQANMKDEIKSLATVMADVAKTLEGLKDIPSIPGWSLVKLNHWVYSSLIQGGSKEILPHVSAPIQMLANPASPKITPPVLSFNLPRPGMEEMYEEDQECVLEDDDEDDEDTNLIDYVHKKGKKRVKPSMESVQLWGQYRKKTTDFRPDD